jgi:2-polyprenyl-3-methyl-5-hydroxy-6-metoxy-1,4-benzoquinol methylase
VGVKTCADKYDELGMGYHWDWLAKARHYVAWIVNILSYIPYSGRGMSVLDFGCGDGVPAWFMSNRGYVVHGYDILEGPLEVAREKVPDATFSTTYPSFQSFDYVVAIGVLEHMEYPDQLVSQVLRAKKHSLVTTVNPGITDPWGLETEYTEDGLRALFIPHKVELKQVGYGDRVYQIAGMSK